jgi:hypothetical protein
MAVVAAHGEERARPFTGCVLVGFGVRLASEQLAASRRRNPDGHEKSPRKVLARSETICYFPDGQVLPRRQEEAP